MRNIQRDTSPVYIGRVSKTPVPETDARGRFTGRNEWPVGEPEIFFPSVTSDKGSVHWEMFGSDLNYDRKLTIADPHFEVREGDRLWMDVSTMSEHDFTVKAVSRSGCFTVIAAERTARTR